MLESPTKWRRQTRPLCRNDLLLLCQLLLCLITCVPERPHHSPLHLYFVCLTHTIPKPLAVSVHCSQQRCGLMSVTSPTPRSLVHFVHWVLTPALLALSICHHQNTKNSLLVILCPMPDSGAMSSSLGSEHPFSGLTEMKAPKAALLCPGPALLLSLQPRHPSTPRPQRGLRGYSRAPSACPGHWWAWEWQGATLPFQQG